MNSQTSDLEYIDMQNIDRVNRNSENVYETIHYYTISDEVKVETSEKTVKSKPPKSGLLTKVLKICTVVFVIVVLAILVFLVAFDRVPKESPLLKDLKAAVQKINLIQETANNISKFNKEPTDSIKIKDLNAAVERINLIHETANNISKFNKAPTDSIKIKDLNAFENSSNPVINKITKALTADFKLRFGRQILHKSGQCLDTTFHIWNEMYLLTPATCNSDSPTQQFRLTPQNTIEVASGQFLPNIQNGKPCLEIYEQSSSGEILAYPCHGGGQQHFFLRIHQRQIDLPNGRIYFSIHSFMYPSRCFTMYRHPSHHRDAFQMDECWGSDKQSFYLMDVNLNQEIGLILSKTEWSSGKV